jgi:tight adherence protein C
MNELIDAQLLVAVAELGLLLSFWCNVHLPLAVVDSLSIWQHLAPSSYMNRLIQLHVRSARRDPDDFKNTLAYKAILWIAACPLVLTGQPTDVFGFILLSVIAFFAPDALLYWCMKRRVRALLKPLPDTIDLMMLCVESGMGLDRAIQRVIQKQPDGPLVQELQILNHQLLLGVKRDVAYRDIFPRTGVAELKQFGAALSQSTKHGLSLATILRTQSELLRTDASVRIEKNANKIPIWMTFPMCFLILPALLMLLAGPAILQNQALVDGLLPQENMGDFYSKVSR